MVQIYEANNPLGLRTNAAKRKWKKNPGVVEADKKESEERTQAREQAKKEGRKINDGWEFDDDDNEELEAKNEGNKDMHVSVHEEKQQTDSTKPPAGEEHAHGTHFQPRRRRRRRSSVSTSTNHQHPQGRRRSSADKEYCLSSDCRASPGNPAIIRRGSAPSDIQRKASRSPSTGGVPPPSSIVADGDAAFNRLFNDASDAAGNIVSGTNSQDFMVQSEVVDSSLSQTKFQSYGGKSLVSTDSPGNNSQSNTAKEATPGTGRQIISDISLSQSGPSQDHSRTTAPRPSESSLLQDPQANVAAAVAQQSADLEPVPRGRMLKSMTNLADLVKGQRILVRLDKHPGFLWHAIVVEGVSKDANKFNVKYLFDGKLEEYTLRSLAPFVLDESPSVSAKIEVGMHLSIVRTFGKHVVATVLRVDATRGLLLQYQDMWKKWVSLSKVGEFYIIPPESGDVSSGLTPHRSKRRRRTVSA